MYVYLYSRAHKEYLKASERQEESKLLQQQDEYLQLEMRKFRRRGLLAYYLKEKSLLMEELTKREQQLEAAHSMLLRHHQQTQDLEYRQQRAIHALKEEQVCGHSLSTASLPDYKMKLQWIKLESNSLSRLFSCISTNKRLSKIYQCYFVSQLGIFYLTQ